MMNQASQTLRRRVGVISLCAAPVLLLVADLLQVLGGHDFAWTTLCWCAFVFFIPAALALRHLERPESDSLGLIGSGGVIVGAMAAAQMMAMFRVRGILLAGVEGLPADALQRIFKAEPGLFLSIFPWSLFFPAGLVLLAFGLLRTGRFGAPIPLLLALGGLLFPFGHASGVSVGLIGSDLLLVVAMGWLALRILRDPAGW